MREAHPGTVLVADDQPILLGLMARVLTRAGFQVRTATNLDEIREVLRTDPDGIDVLLLDGRLSYRMGLSTLRALASRHPPPGIVLTSGADLDPSLALWLAESGGRFLEKPFEPGGLVRAVTQVCPRRGRTAPPPE